MASSPWTKHPNGDLRVLQVPTVADKANEQKCLAHSLYMVLTYMSDFYPDEWVNENTNKLSVEEIIQRITHSPSGWRPREDDFEEISEQAGAVQFKYVLKDRPLSDERLLGILNENLNDHLPVVPFINAKKLRKNQRGGVHAVVVVGMENDTVALNDSWGYLYDKVDASRFLEAWNDTLNQFVLVEPGSQQSVSNQNGGDPQ